MRRVGVVIKTTSAEATELGKELLDELALRGAAMGPIAPPPAPEGADLSGRRIVHLTSVHRPRDVRIFHKEARALAGAGATALVGAPSAPIPRQLSQGMNSCS